MHETQIRAEEVVSLFRKYCTTRELEGKGRQDVIHETYFKLQLKLPKITAKTLGNQALGLTRLSYDVGIALVDFLSEWENQNKTKTKVKK